MNLIEFFKSFGKKETVQELPAIESSKSKEAAKERLHLVLMQDRVNVSVDFLDLMKQEIVDAMKKYIEVDESEIDVRFTNKTNEDGTNGAPALYANIPILSIKNDNIINTKRDSNNNVANVNISNNLKNNSINSKMENMSKNLQDDIENDKKVTKVTKNTTAKSAKSVSK